MDESEVIDAESTENSANPESDDPIYALEGTKVADILLRQDYGSLTVAEQISFINHKCNRLGIDITLGAFVFIDAPTKKDPDRKLLINTKQLYSHLTTKYQLDIRIVQNDTVIYVTHTFARVVAEVTNPHTGAKVQDQGLVYIHKLMSPADIGNAIMKATTKAKCRAIHNAVGIGGLSYIEAADISGSSMPQLAARSSIASKRVTPKK